MMGYDIQVLKGANRTTAGNCRVLIPVRPAGVMTHDDVPDIAALKGKPILIAGSSRITFWPWLRAKYGFTDDQIRPYTFNLQPFFADKDVAQQGYPSSEPYQALQQNEKVKFFLLADGGYPPYGSTIVTTETMIAGIPMCGALREGIAEGWRDYIKNPAPGTP